MRALPWIISGGAAAVALSYYVWARRREVEDGQAGDVGSSGDDWPSRPSGAGPTRPPVGPLPGRWVWPVGVWNGRKPEISSDFTSPRRSGSGERIPHGGVDIMYARQPGDPWRASTTNGSARFVMPDHRAALAASDGVVRSATRQPRGWTVVIDHAPRQLATFYTHMSSLLVAPKQPISAGAPIGVIGSDPLDDEHLKHLHLEAWAGGAADRFDPQPFMAHWEYLPDPGDVPDTLVARNGGHRGGDGASFTVPVTSHYRRLPRR